MFVYAQILPTTTIGVVELFGLHAEKNKINETIFRIFRLYLYSTFKTKSYELY